MTSVWEPSRRGSWRPRRPGFMSATVVAALLMAPGSGYLAERFADPRAVAQAMADEADTAARAGMLELGWQPLAGAGAAAAGELRRARDVELLHAKRAFLAASGFRRVLLCQGLREGAVTIPSLPNYERTLILDASTKPEMLRRLLHHELFHFADYADDEQVQRDPAWLALDDKAETFAFMMVAPGDIARIAARDPIVRAKTAHVKRQLERLCPALDAAFWRRVDAAR